MTSQSPQPDPRVLDLYKLAVEMADRVSARRGTANAFFVTVQSAVVTALGFLAARKPTPHDRYLIALCSVGVAACLIWFLLLRSYRDLNTAKFKVINALEAQLPVALFKDEWEYLKEDPVSPWRKRYAELGTTAIGSIERRRRTTIPVFKKAVVQMPPLVEQRRIADVIAAVDEQVEALAREMTASRSALGPMTEYLLSGDSGWPDTPLGEVGEFSRGKRFTKADYVESGLGVIHYAHIHTHFGPVATDVIAHVPNEARGRLRLASRGDVVIAATSEDLAGVGKATVWLGDDDVAVHDDAQIFRHRLDPHFAVFLFSSPSFQSQKIKYAGGTKVTRISGPDLAKISVPIPPMVDQVRIGSALSKIVAGAERIQTELASLRIFRSALLFSLLKQEIEIPESYDSMLAGVS